MHPVLFRIGNFTVGTYGVMIVLGLLAGLWLAVRLARRRGLPTDFFLDLPMVLLISGFVGARVLFIALDWQGFVRDPLPYIFSRQGFVFLGGFVAATAAAIWYARRHRMPLLEMGDVVAPGLVLAHAFGRIGCFLAGCCYGRSCVPGDHEHSLCEHLSVQYPLVLDPDGQISQMFNFAYSGQISDGLLSPGASAPLPIIPVQLFESLGNVLICLALVWLWRRRKFSGQIFAAYLMLYGWLRFGLEFLRGDSDRGLWLGGHISTSQIICLVMILISAGLWMALRRRGLCDLSSMAPPTPAAAPAKQENRPHRKGSKRAQGPVTK